MSLILMSLSYFPNCLSNVFIATTTGWIYRPEHKSFLSAERSNHNSYINKSMILVKTKQKGGGKQFSHLRAAQVKHTSSTVPGCTENQNHTII